MTQSHHGGDVAQLARAAGCAPEDILDFSASINPLGPPEWLRPAISSAVSSLVHYPDPHCRELLAAASARYGVPEAQLVAGNGTSDLLFALARAMKGKGATHAVIPAPAYVDYRTACERAGLAAESLILNHADGFRLDEAALLDTLRPGSAAFLGRPGNPTGRDVPADTVRRLAAARPDCLFVADEAFGSFVEGFESLVRDRPANVAVLLSLTKMFAIPGLRLGLLCAGDDLAGLVRAQLSPWSVNTLAQAVGLRAMADREFEARSRENAAALRRELAAGLAALPGIEVFPGAANYLLCRLEKPDVPALRARLLTRRIAIRDCSNFEGLDARFFRVAVRARDDNERLLEALEAELAPARQRVIRKRRTPALMIQGTTSNAGKSVLAAALCRILRQDGVRVAPFKSQNMSLNSCVTPWGEEMGRAQVLQAQACGLAPQARMNPVLLKPCSDTGSQVIVMGKPVGNMRVREYVAYKPTAFAAAKQAYDSLAGEFEAVILEGAGSPAEVNLKHHDMVNMAMAAHAGARVLLAGDIDRGGVFAALCGTMELLSESERAMVGGYVLNRFRGDPSLLDPALEFMRATTGKRVLGVVPNIEPLGLPEEDSVSFKQGGFGSTGPREPGAGVLDIAVLDLPHISNFTDFDALAREPDVSLRVVRSPEELGRPDAVLLPGSKNTLADLAHLRAAGLAEAVARLDGVEVVGVCAGLQMLGARILDPLGLESDRGEEAGLGLLPLVTELMPEKTLTRAEALHAASGHTLRGYEIHHGETVATRDDAPGLFARQDGRPLGWGRMGGVWGTYLHGLFDADGFRGWWLDALRARKGLAPMERAVSGQGEDAAVDAALDRLAAVVRKNLDMEAVYALLGL
ncbi:cobyric acid synthase [Fundidesulfovibrio agrisoli]|uniref:cobyric acid synthase n=1 Tax=Fundidesulfovibrio agrisoli TaxID=2922717 RepID=UPI001FADCD03|nr:cobyric acid synthase [Fundidesulfovibrio agrisoli]